MTLIRIEQPGTGRNFIVGGRHAPVVRSPHLKLRNYLLKSLPPPPATADYSVQPDAFLHNILANDECGDCTCAAAYHINGTLLANAGADIPFTQDDCRNLYIQLSGWNGTVNDPSDTGLDEMTVLNYWAVNGLQNGQHKLDGGYVSVDATNQEEVQQAVYLFENLYFAVALPNKWVSPMPSQDGFTWDYAGTPNPNAGHAYCAAGYDAGGVKVDTWGMTGTETYAAVAAYAVPAAGGALYACLSSDIVIKASGKAPVGFDWTQLLADMQAIGVA